MTVYTVRGKVDAKDCPPLVERGAEGPHILTTDFDDLDGALAHYESAKTDFPGEWSVWESEINHHTRVVDLHKVAP